MSLTPQKLIDLHEELTTLRRGFLIIGDVEGYPHRNDEFVLTELAVVDALDQMSTALNSIRRARIHLERAEGIERNRQRPGGILGPNGWIEP